MTDEELAKRLDALQNAIHARIEAMEKRVCDGMSLMEMQLDSQIALLGVKLRDTSSVPSTSNVTELLFKRLGKIEDRVDKLERWRMGER